MKYAKRLLILAMLVIGGIVTLPAASSAQGLFDPVIKVNDSVITRYELEQRARLLSVLNAPGDPARLAREQLIEERLKMGAARASSLELTEEGVQAGLTEFAARGNMGPEEFITAMEGEGVAEQTVRDFVTTGVTWRQLIAARFGSRVQITEADVDKALNAMTGGSSVRVLLSELIMPAPPQQAAEIRARANQLSQINSIEAFSDAVRRFSAAETSRNGGKLDWMQITKLPPSLRPSILSLAPGQVTDPVGLEGAIALFQLRAIEEAGVKSPDYTAIDYATYLIPGGRSEAALQQAANVAARVDTCDDLYGVVKEAPAQRLSRDARKPGDIPSDIAVELAKLDPGEVSTALTRDSGEGQALVLLMLCGRTAASQQDASREEVKQSLRSDRLESHAQSYLAQLRADARIVSE